MPVMVCSNNGFNLKYNFQYNITSSGIGYVRWVVDCSIVSSTEAHEKRIQSNAGHLKRTFRWPTKKRTELRTKALYDQHWQSLAWHCLSLPQSTPQTLLFNAHQCRQRWSMTWPSAGNDYQNALYKFSEVLSQNCICFHWPSMAYDSKKMHCGIFLNLLYSLNQGCPKCGSRANSALWLILLGSLPGLDYCNVWDFWMSAPI